MRGVGITDIFMTLMILFLLIVLVIAIGLIDTTNPATFTVRSGTAEQVFSFALIGGALHELITIEQRADPDLAFPDELRSIAESVDRTDEREGVPLIDGVPSPSIAHMSLSPVPGFSGAPRTTFVMLDDDIVASNVIYIPESGGWLVRFDDDSAYTLGQSSQRGDAYAGIAGVVYALE